MDQDSLRALQRQNELKAFLRYENALRTAYAKSQDPHPPRWMRSSHGRGLQGDCQFDAPC